MLHFGVPTDYTRVVTPHTLHVMQCGYSCVVDTRLPDILTGYIVINRVCLQSSQPFLFCMQYLHVYYNTVIRRLTTGKISAKCVVRRFRRCANITEYTYNKPRYCFLLHTQAIWYSLLILGYKPVQHVTVLNTVGSCNTMVLYYYDTVPFLSLYIRLLCFVCFCLIL